MKKGHSIQTIIDYILGDQIDDEKIELAIKEVADSRPDLQELQNILLEEGNDMFDIMGDQYLCSDILDMMPELAEMDPKEIEIKKPKVWKHISACESCQKMFLLVSSTAKEIDHASISEIGVLDNIDVSKLNRKWDLKEIKKRKDEPIFQVVRGWLEGFDLPNLESEKSELNFFFDNPPEIDEKGRFKMTLSFSDDSFINQTLRIELRDDINSLKLCEVPIKKKRIDVLIDFSMFSIGPISFPTDAIHLELVRQKSFIDFLKSLYDKKLSPIDFVDHFTDNLSRTSETLETILDKEYESSEDKNQFIELIEYAKKQIEEYVQIWEMYNNEKPDEQKFAQILAKILNQIHQTLIPAKPVEKETTLVSNRPQISAEPTEQKTTIVSRQSKISKKDEDKINGG